MWWSATGWMFTNILKDHGPRNIKNLTPNDAVSNLGKPERSATPQYRTSYLTMTICPEKSKTTTPHVFAWDHYFFFLHLNKFQFPQRRDDRHNTVRRSFHLQLRRIVYETYSTIRIHTQWESLTVGQGCCLQTQLQTYTQYSPAKLNANTSHCWDHKNEIRYCWNAKHASC